MDAGQTGGSLGLAEGWSSCGMGRLTLLGPIIRWIAPGHHALAAAIIPVTVIGVPKPTQVVKFLNTQC